MVRPQDREGLTRVHRRIRKVTDRSRLDHVADGEAADGLVLCRGDGSVSGSRHGEAVEGGLTLGHMREQLEQRIEATWPRPFLLRPPALLFFVTVDSNHWKRCQLLAMAS
jgi:hypothetical protein